MSIRYSDELRTFYLTGKGFSYIMRVTPQGYLYHTYYGERLPDCDLSYYTPSTAPSFNTSIPGTSIRMCAIMQEYATEFLGDFREPALVPLDARGSRSCDLKYESYDILPEKPAVRSGIPTARGGETLVITLRDEATGLRVLLYYTVYADEDIITRRAEIVNNTQGNVHLERALSMTLEFFDRNFELVTIYGRHAHERNPQVTPLLQGRISVGNVRGITSHMHAPIVILRRPGAGEQSGEVYAASLTYSGSHYESVEVDESERARISMGINPESFNWLLEPGDSFETPEAVLCYSREGMGGMTRRHHDFFRKYMINPRWVDQSRPVVLNSWEGMRFSFDRDRLFETIDALEGRGIDTFVLDDGWFGARDNDRAGLGDWFVNEKKLPGGLSAIAEHCHEKGLKFGLWIEPEMVNPDSELYRAHPDWAITTPGRIPHEGRNQLVLDLTRRDVLDYIKNLMREVIATSGADYIKWDMNRSLSDNWSHMLPPERQGEVQHRYVLGVYELARYLTLECFPDVFFEGCSGGGGRFDAAMLAFFPQIWSSDNTDAYCRARIQYGTQLIYPLCASSNHVSRCPNRQTGRIANTDTRRNIAFFGAYGYEFDIKKLSEEELERIPADIAKYRELEQLMLCGDLYRNHTTFDGDCNELVQTVVSKDKRHAVTLYFQALDTVVGSPWIKVDGLDDSLSYHIEELDLTLPGAVLRCIGVVLPRFKHDFGSVLLTLNAVDEG